MRLQKKGLTISVLLIVSLFLLGCEAGDDELELLEGPYVGGNDGVEFAFQEDEPPQAVLDDSQQEFFITLLVRNQGEYTIPDGEAIASLSGIDAKAFGLTSMDATNTVPIQGTSNDQGFLLEGAEELLEFKPAKYVNDVAADFSVPLRADLCYGYKTEGLAHLCLKKDVVQQSIEDVCSTTNPDVDLFNSGAPIQVENLRQKAIGSDKVQISFTIRNVGSGIVYLPGSFTDSCKGQNDVKDMVHVMLDNPQDNFVPTCSSFAKTNEGDIRLVGGKKDITCTVSTSDLQDVSYQDLLIVEVSYVYRESVSTVLNVQNAI